MPGTGYGLSWAPGYIFLSSDIKNDESLIRVLAMYMKYIGLSHCPPNQFVRSLSYTLLIILHRVTGKEHDDVTLANDAVMEIYVVRSEVNDGVIEFQNSVIDLSGASSEKESDEMRVDEVITEIFDVTSEEKDGVMEDGKGTTEISGLTIS